MFLCIVTNGIDLTSPISKASSMSTLSLGESSTKMSNVPINDVPTPSITPGTPKNVTVDIVDSGYIMQPETN